MEDSKLIQVLKKLNTEEVERLITFMDSPFFIKQKSLSDFAKLVLIEYPGFASEAVNEKSLYEKLYPNQNFQHKTIADLMTSMINSVYDFLTVDNFLQSDKEKGMRLLESLRSKGLDKEFSRTVKKIEEDLELSKKDQQYYNYVARLQNEIDTFNIQNIQHLGSSQYLQARSAALDTYFISAKLKLVCDLISRQNVFSTETNIDLLDEMMAFINTHIEKYDTLPAVNIYYRIILTLMWPDEEKYFKDLLAHLEHITENFEKNELRQIYAFAQNYCIGKINYGRVEYVRELFGIYVKLINTGTIYEDNVLNLWDYKNIATIGLRVKEYEWTEAFIHANKDKIQPGFRETAFCYNLANYFYEKKEFRSAIKMLNQFNDALRQISDPGFEDTYYNLDSRSMFLKIYYELEEDESFMATIETFKSFLKRNRKVSEGQRKAYVNLLKYAKKLNDMKRRYLPVAGRYAYKTIAKFKIEISAEQNIGNLTWILGMADRLEQKIASVTEIGPVVIPKKKKRRKLKKKRKPLP